MSKHDEYCNIEWANDEELDCDCERIEFARWDELKRIVDLIESHWCLSCQNPHWGGRTYGMCSCPNLPNLIALIKGKQK